MWSVPTFPASEPLHRLFSPLGILFLLSYVMDFLVYQSFYLSWNHYSEFTCNNKKKKGSVNSRLTCEQDAADHPWHHHEEHGQQFQVPTHDAGGLHMWHVLARQAALHNDLPGEHDVVARKPEGDFSEGECLTSELMLQWKRESW